MVYSGNSFLSVSMLFFIGEGGKRPLVAMVTKGEVSGGGVGGRVGAESCPFVKYQNALLLETVF